MYNYLFAVDLPMRLAGKKLPAILADSSGASERTWRNRLTSDWNPSASQIADIKSRQEQFVKKKLTKGGWSEDEIAQIIARWPSLKDGASRPTADLIFMTSPRFGEGYELAIEIAVEFDCLCADIAESLTTQDTPRFQRSMLDVLQWLRKSASSDDDANVLDNFEGQVRGANDIAALRKVADQVSEDMLFHVLTSWDLIFCSAYSNGKLKPAALFPLVMPGWAPGVEFDDESGRIQRKGSQATGRIFEKAMSRLFDFLATLIEWHKLDKSPITRPLVKDMSRWFDEPENRIVSWRDETTRFTLRNFENIWVRAVESGADCNSARTPAPGMPTPMLVATLIWGRLLQRENGQEKSCTFCIDPYLDWWRRNLARMKSKGVPYGDIPLPACLTD